MTEIDQPAGEDGAVQQRGRWGLAVGAVALVCLALGFAAGIAEPVSIFSSDPQWGLLIFLFGIPAGAVFGVIAVVILLVGHVPRITGTVFLAILALIGGDIVGVAVRDSVDRAEQAGDRWASAAPTSLSANATVTFSLPDQRGFVAIDPEPMGDGLFGQWCTSERDGLAVFELEASDVGRLDGYLVRIELWLTDPSGAFSRSGIPVPRIVVTATDDDGMVQYGQWTGRATKMAGDGTTGRARFNSLVLQGAAPGLNPPRTLSGEVTWSCGSWQEL